MAAPHLLVPVDFSDASAAALRIALRLGERSGASVEVLHVAEVSDRVWDEDDAQRERLDEQLASFVAEHGGGAVRARVVHGDRAAHAASEAAEAGGATMIVVGTRGHGRLHNLLVGSTTERIARTAPCPVLAVPPDGMFGPGPVVAGVDLGDDSVHGISAAKTLAAALGTGVVLFHVIEELQVPGIYGPVEHPMLEAFPEIRNRVADALNALGRDAPGPAVPVETAIGDGRAEDALLRFSEEQEAAALVLTAHRDPVVHLLLGSTTEKVLRRLARPLLLVRSPQPS